MKAQTDIPLVALIVIISNRVITLNTI